MDVVFDSVFYICLLIGFIICSIGTFTTGNAKIQSVLIALIIIDGIVFIANICMAGGYLIAKTL